MKNLLIALSKAKKEFKPILKDKDNPYFKSKYADFDNYLEATKEGLANNNLVVTQTLEYNESHDFLVTTLWHTESGEFINSKMRFAHLTKNAQDLGSLLTYYRRYSYASILCLTSEDDDGNIASNKQETKKEPVKQVTKIEKLPDIQSKFKLVKQEEKKKWLDTALKRMDTDFSDATDYQSCINFINSELSKLNGETK